MQSRNVSGKVLSVQKKSGWNLPKFKMQYDKSSFSEMDEEIEISKKDV